MVCPYRLCVSVKRFRALVLVRADAFEKIYATAAAGICAPLS